MSQSSNASVLDQIASLSQQYAELFLWLTLFSVVTVVLMMTFGVRILAKLPSDYFLDDEKRTADQFWNHYPWFARYAFIIGKNLLGLIFVISGLILLIVPGQGLLTMLAGLLLMNFPRKYDLQRWLIRRPQVRKSIDWLRQRSGEPPLNLD